MIKEWAIRVLVASRRVNHVNGVIIFIVFPETEGKRLDDYPNEGVLG